MAGHQRGRVAAEIVGGIGLLWSLARWGWELLGDWQQAEQTITDWPRFVQWVGSPLAGPALVIIALLVYVALQFWPEPKPQVVPQDDPLVGRFFHTFHRGGNNDGELQFQGYIIRKQDGRYFIQLFEALLGDPSDQRFMTDDELLRAVFYDTEEEWHHAYERWARRRRIQ
jgi:hypothetical protein